MKKMLFIFNPYSGKAQIKNKLLEIIQIFTENGYSVEVFPTGKSGDASNVIVSRGCEFDKIVISGGDGTLNESINGLLKLPSEKRPEIGYIPAGTTNDFASNLKIPKNMIKAANIAVDGSEFRCDIGRFNEKNFLYVAAFGAFTDVPYETPQMNKNYLGHLAYLLEGMKKLYSLKTYELSVTADGVSYSGEFIFGMASNSNYVAGLKTSSKLHAALNDGIFEVMLIKKPKNLLEFQNIISDLLTQNFSSDQFLVFKTDRVEFCFKDETPWTLDGEYGGKIKIADISLECEAVSFFSGIKNNS